MSHNLGLEVIAEGIEEPIQVDFLKRHRCQKGKAICIINHYQLKRLYNNIL